MDLITRFIPYQLPRQFVLLSEQRIRAMLPNPDSGAWKTIDVGALQDGKLDEEVLRRLKEALRPGPTGLMLSFHYFIFNLFTFDRIPWPSKTRRELVEWKLEKVFPEKIESYCHRYFKIDARTILSILVKKDLLEQLQEQLRRSGMLIAFAGSSSIELYNYIMRRSRPPDCIIDCDQSNVLLIFQKKKRLLYLRKFRSDSREEMAEEIAKTIHYVQEHFSFASKTCGLFAPPGSVTTEERNDLEDKLGQLGIRALDNLPLYPCLPVKA